MRLWPRPNQTDIQLLEPLGEGLTSQVYRAIRKHSDLGIEQTVAVKVLNSRNEVQTLKNEIDALIKVESHHCVRLLGWADLKKGPAIILEFLDGVSLFDLCAYSRVEPNLVEEITAQLQTGLRDLHACGIFHGDLSARNIFVTSTGIVKILDFGFSGSHGNGPLYGTPQFLALEAWSGGELTQKADLFSLGLLRLDLLEHAVVHYQSKEAWRRRAEAVAGKNALLARAPEKRDFLDTVTGVENREQLASIVKKVQIKKRALKTTTRIIGDSVKATLKARPLHFASALFFIVFLFFHNLQPASLDLKKLDSHLSAVNLDVRSHGWAQIKLFKKPPHGDLVDAQPAAAGIYAPFRFKNLPHGNYELHWAAKGRKGIISVQLNQSQRILIK